MSNVCYLFFGFASEYILNPLYQTMHQMGLDCIEMDLFTAKNVKQTLSSLKKRPVVFINCAHLFFDAANFSTSYQYKGEIISPLEVIDYLKPIKSVYIPHDLCQFFHEKERAWLNLFDLLLIPHAMPSYLYSHPKVVDVGWIKRSKPVYPVTKEISRSVGFAFSEFEYHRRLGPEKTYEFWSTILKNQKIVIKFPHWQETDVFEDYFRKKGVAVFPSTVNISDFIDQHGIILCNGSSSVNSEAAFSGRQVINILYNDYTLQSQKRSLGLLPNIQYLNIQNCATYLSQIHDKNTFEILMPPLVKPFDFDKVAQLLTQPVVESELTCIS
jgi:hypothetical protein